MLNLLHHLPDFLLTVLASWLGLSLLVRAPHDRATRAFAWFCLNLALYGATSLLPQLTSDPAVGAAFNRLQLAITALAPAAFLHFIAILTTPAQVPRALYLLIGVFYLTGAALALYALGGALPAPAQPFPGWSRWGEPRFPVGPLDWAWTAQRILPLLLATMLIWRAYRRATNDAHEQRLRRIFAITATVGVIGALAATAARAFSASPAVPRTVILVAMLALAYAVLAYRALLPPRVAQRTFFYSIIGSLITTFYISLLLSLEWVVQNWLQIDAPLVTVFALVVMVAVLGPLREWFRDRLDRRFYRREFDFGRLIRALNDDLFERGSLEDQLQAALSAICRALGVRAGLIVLTTPEGLAPYAAYGVAAPQPLPRLLALPADQEELAGQWEPWGAAQLLLQLRRGDENLGVLVLGPRRSGQPFNATERSLIDYLGGYLTLAITHARARDVQQAAMAALATQSQALKEQQERLEQQAAAAALPERTAPATAPEGGLRIYALGPLRVERDGAPITRWGGDKAGTYQAEALFAFLFDRRGKGITKDEAAEVIWPDLDIGKADAAFHRTIAALRRTLEPELRRGNESRAITYHHERYWLEPVFVAWCDADAFVAAAEQGATRAHQGNQAEALAALEWASELYRGDYMDDCPFFGDSAYVEEQRGVLRARYVEVQLALGALYEAQGRAGEAASAYRRALATSPAGCPPATEGLNRLRAVT